MLGRLDSKARIQIVALASILVFLAFIIGIGVYIYATHYSSYELNCVVTYYTIYPPNGGENGSSSSQLVHASTNSYVTSATVEKTPGYVITTTIVVNAFSVYNNTETTFSVVPGHSIVRNCTYR
jgi:hypothetical protein